MAALSPLGAIVRRHDPDRFLTVLFAPPARREALFVLYAFNHELARAREAAREPTVALIRLQWWREVVEGARRRHEVAEPLADALGAGVLRQADLLAMIEGREAEADPIETLAEWRDYVRATAGGVAVAAGHVLGADPAVAKALRSYGAAYGVSGLLRAQAALARRGRSLMPVETVQRSGLAAARTALAAEGRRWLDEARRHLLTRSVLPAGLPAAYAQPDLRRPERAEGQRPPSARLRVILAGLSGRV